jgi:hypothetical protein
MSKLVCASCGYRPEWGIEDWGRDPETHGIGPDPVCPALVVDHRFPVPPGTPESHVPKMTCRGVLVPIQAAARKGEA